MKKSKIIILCFFTICVLTLGFLQLNKIIKIIDFSSINVKIENELDIEQVKIIQGFFSINRESDEELFIDKNPKIVFNGNKKVKIKTEYGENDFLVIYNNKHYFQFRQFCTNDNDYYIYNLNLFKKDSEIYIRGEIEPSGRKFEKKLNLIQNAKKMRCNNLIDNEKGLYNGIELK